MTRKTKLEPDGYIVSIDSLCHWAEGVVLDSTVATVAGGDVDEASLDENTTIVIMATAVTTMSRTMKAAMNRFCLSLKSTILYFLTSTITLREKKILVYPIPAEKSE